MPVCPACEAENLPDSPAADAADSPRTSSSRSLRGRVLKEDPRYELQVRELIEAMGDLASGPAESVDAALTAPSRFPGLAPARPTPCRGTRSCRSAPSRNAPPCRRRRGSSSSVTEIDEYLRLGHRLSLDEAALEHRSRDLAGSRMPSSSTGSRRTFSSGSRRP